MALSSARLGGSGLLPICTGVARTSPPSKQLPARAALPHRPDPFHDNFSVRWPSPRDRQRIPRVDVKIHSKDAPHIARDPLRNWLVGSGAFWLESTVDAELETGRWIGFTGQVRYHCLLPYHLNVDILQELQKNLQEKNDDLEKTLQQLQATQEELIQAEKMAALIST